MLIYHHEADYDEDRSHRIAEHHMFRRAPGADEFWKNATKEDGNEQRGKHQRYSACDRNQRFDGRENQGELVETVADDIEQVFAHGIGEIMLVVLADEEGLNDGLAPTFHKDAREENE